jgi:membrane-associated protease RseP (regulator of RpoE activity)
MRWTEGVCNLSRIQSISTFTFLILLVGSASDAQTINGGVSETAVPEQQQQQLEQQQIQQQQIQSEMPQAAPQVLYGQTQSNAQYDEQGHRIVGVLGAKVDMIHGFVQAVFPPSSLNQWGIHPGDRVLGYDYHPWKDGWDMERAINAGPPGAVIQITILHDNRMLNIMAPRVDSRALVGYDRFLGNHYFQKRVNQSQY